MSETLHQWLSTGGHRTEPATGKLRRYRPSFTAAEQVALDALREQHYRGTGDSELPPGVTLADAILLWVRARDNVTFAELHDFPGFQGNLEISLADKAGQRNLVLWSGLSMAALEALTSLLDGERIYFTPTPALTYLIDGHMLRLPMVKGNYAYRKPHWLPVVMRPGPNPWKKKGRDPAIPITPASADEPESIVRVSEKETKK